MLILKLSLPRAHGKVGGKASYPRSRPSHPEQLSQEALSLQDHSRGILIQVPTHSPTALS